MNQVDALCTRCGQPCLYTGLLPILCRDCRSQDSWKKYALTVVENKKS